MRIVRLLHRITCHVCEVPGAAEVFAWNAALCVVCLERVFVEMTGAAERGGLVPVNADELLTMAERRSAA